MKAGLLIPTAMLYYHVKARSVTAFDRSKSAIKWYLACGSSGASKAADSLATCFADVMKLAYIELSNDLCDRGKARASTDCPACPGHPCWLSRLKFSLDADS